MSQVLPRNTLREFSNFSGLLCSRPPLLPFTTTLSCLLSCRSSPKMATLTHTTQGSHAPHALLHAVSCLLLPSSPQSIIEAATASPRAAADNRLCWHSLWWRERSICCHPRCCPPPTPHMCRPIPRAAPLYKSLMVNEPQSAVSLCPFLPVIVVDH